jgi:hypothetical protein
MLNDSVASFRRHFKCATFTVSVAQDATSILAARLPGYLQKHTLPNPLPVRAGDELWLKWFRQDIYEQADALITLDADVFCVSSPHSLLSWLNTNAAPNLIVLSEADAQAWHYGNYADALPEIPMVNAGFVAVRKPKEFLREMQRQYELYIQRVRTEDVKWHDEQGALASVWLRRHARGDACLLPEATNRLSCPSANPSVSSVKGLEIIHTAYPDHPQYVALKDQIRSAYA